MTKYTVFWALDPEKTMKTELDASKVEMKDGLLFFYDKQSARLPNYIFQINRVLYVERTSEVAIDQ